VSRGGSHVHVPHRPPWCRRLAAALPLALVGSASHADEICRTVEGRYTESSFGGPECTSPIGLCITADYTGDVRGRATAVATSLVATADTPATAVSLFTSDSTLEAAVGSRRGTLTIKNAGAFRGVGEGSIVDLQTIVGATGGLAGATGDLRASGVVSFATGTGTSAYRGTICLLRG
jgi:hypothetical protein